jgi:hypothetical protein
MTGDSPSGRGAGPDATGVEPSAAQPVQAAAGSGEMEVPLGLPVGGDEMRELKRRAERPDPSDQHEAPGHEDPSAPG